MNVWQAAHVIPDLHHDDCVADGVASPVGEDVDDAEDVRDSKLVGVDGDESVASAVAVLDDEMEDAGAENDAVCAEEGADATMQSYPSPSPASCREENPNSAPTSL